MEKVVFTWPAVLELSGTVTLLYLHTEGCRIRF